MTANLSQVARAMHAHNASRATSPSHCCYAATLGCQVRTGRRQSMPSSSIDSCAAERCTTPLVAWGHTNRPRSSASRTGSFRPHSTTRASPDRRAGRGTRTHRPRTAVHLTPSHQRRQTVHARHISVTPAAIHTRVPSGKPIIDRQRINERLQQLRTGRTVEARHAPWQFDLQGHGRSSALTTTLTADGFRTATGNSATPESATSPNPPRRNFTTHLRTMLALAWCAMATPASDAPDTRHSRTIANFSPSYTAGGALPPAPSARFSALACSDHWRPPMG